MNLDKHSSAVTFGTLKGQAATRVVTGGAAATTLSGYALGQEQPFGGALCIQGTF